MNADQSADFVSEMMDTWPGEWDPGHIAQWFEALESVDHFGRAMRALGNMRLSRSYRPALADFAAAYHELEVDDARYDERMGGSKLHETLLDPDLNHEWLERVRLIRSRGRQLEEHDHREGASGCPVCSVHTHGTGGPCARCDEIIGAMP